MIRRKKDVKRIFFVSLFITSMLLVNIQIFNGLYLDSSNNQLTNLLDDDDNLISSEIDPYLTDYYVTGSGDPQDVIIYALNSSDSNDNNQNSFDIPSMSDINTTYLTYGNFNFTFQNNFTTDYIIEDTSALDANEFIHFTYNNSESSMNVNIGENLTEIDLGLLVDGLPSSIELNSSSGILNFTISASFASTFYEGPIFDLDFNRSVILSIISTISHSIDMDANMTIQLFDTVDSSWKNVTEAFLINHTLGIQSVKERYINENLKYINSSDITQIQFFLRRSDSTDFVLSLKEFKLNATYAFDLPITDSEYVALEFDLKGESSAVNGFYAWIRTLNLTEAPNAELNITLYEANSTITRTPANLESNNLKPNNTKLIDSIIIDYNDYHGDSLSYFEFNQANTTNLKLYNYFIVIKSNHSDKIFSLVTLPKQEYGDAYPYRIDHQLRTTNDYGITWNVAKKEVTPGYTSEVLDASAFKLNVTRGYMPSDFINPDDNQDTLEIQDISIENQIISDHPYNVSSSLEWGLGQWKNNFTVEILNNSLNNFKIDLTWNNTIIKGFKFNVTYTVKAYWVENANSDYKVSYDTTPIWSLNYTLDLGYTNFDNWNFHEFWFVYPNDWDAKNLTNPAPFYDEIYDEVINTTGGETNLVANPSYDFTAINNATVNGIDGTYSLNLTSSNLIHETYSYINYNGILWETNGFMYGDNISVGVAIQGPGSIPPINGNANVTLFYPDNSTIFPGAEINSGAGVIKGNSLVYDFNNQTILDVTEDTPLLGNYYLGYFWENGSAVGCNKLKLYIDTYDVNMNSLLYEPILNQNILDGIVDKVYENYSMLIGTVKVTDDTYYPDFYAVNNSDINQQFIYEINGNKIPILVKTFLQNETLLNPNEDIKIGATIQNLHGFVDLEVKLKVQLVSLVNEEWIIAEKYTDLKTLKAGIDPNGADTQEFSVNLTIPTLQADGIWQGVNAPVRKGGAKTILTVYFDYDGESHEVDTFESNDYSLLINSNQSEFEGYIISLKYDEEITGASILKPFEREACQYMPVQTTLVVNIYDKNFVSSYNQFIDSFSLKSNSQFSDIVVNPQTPIYGQKFNISSVLTTEFGYEITNKKVICQYFNNGLWENVSSQNSGANGDTSFEIDTLSLPRDDNLLFRLTWQGDSYILDNSQNISVSIYKVSSNISLGIASDVNQITRNSKTTITITLSNIGDSELTISNSSISIIIEPSLTYSIVELNYLKLNNLQPGESTDIIVSIEIPTINQMTITVSVEATIKLTKENITAQALKTFNIYDIPLTNYISFFFTVIMIGIFVLLWGVMYLYIKRTTKKIETPIEEPSKKKPRRGKYVSVSELPKEEPKEEPKKIAAKKPSKKLSKKPKQEKIKTEKPATDLDSLLEEKGLKDK